MLQENYPDVPKLNLECIFEECNYNYSHAVTVLNASLGAKPKPTKPFESVRPSASAEEITGPTVTSQVI